MKETVIWEKGSLEELNKIVQAFYTVIFFPETSYDIIEIIVSADTKYPRSDENQIQEMNIYIAPIKNNKYLIPKSDQFQLYDKVTQKILYYINKEIYVFGWIEKDGVEEKIDYNLKNIISQQNHHHFVDQKIFLQNYLEKYLNKKEIDRLIYQLKEDHQKIFHRI